MKFKNYTEQTLREVIANSFSLAETLRNLKIVPAGGNYQTLKKAISVLDIDIIHFTGQGHLKGKTHTWNLRPISEIMIYGKYEQSNSLKKRLFKEKIKDEMCESCQLSEWQNVKIPLELHHKDGDRKNNTLNNLQVLCPNCHALTSNYRGKNKKSNFVARKNFAIPYLKKPDKLCVDCSVVIDTKSTRCRICVAVQQKLKSKTKINWPKTSELKQMLENESFSGVAKKLGVSDNAIRKRIKNHESFSLSQPCELSCRD